MKRWILKQSTKNGLINIIFNKDGIGNYDIALKDEKTIDDGKSSPLSLKIQKNTKLRISSLNILTKVQKSKW
jgi:hypothetical protein